VGLAWLTLPRPKTCCAETHLCKPGWHVRTHRGESQLCCAKWLHEPSIAFRASIRPLRLSGHPQSWQPTIQSQSPRLLKSMQLLSTRSATESCGELQIRP